MTAKLISGAEIAAQIREEIKQEVLQLKAKHNIVPGLATVLLGTDPGSLSYITGKEKTAKELGFYSERIDLPETTSQKDLLAIIDKLNKDPKIHGILVQEPLPKHINADEVNYAIDPKKDVDVFHPVNVGRLMIGDADLSALHPRRHSAIADTFRRADRRRRGGSGWPQQYRRQTDCQYVIAEK